MTIPPRALGNATPTAYPRELERDVTLKNGARVHVRPIRPEDASRLVAVYQRLSFQSSYQRFFTAVRRLPPNWARFLATVDYHRRLASVAEHAAADGPGLLAVARYEPSQDDAPEVAFVVLDAWQNVGLGTILFQALLDAAMARGIRRFRAYVLADNMRMLDLINRFADVRERRRDGAVLELIFTPRPSLNAPATPTTASG